MIVVSIWAVRTSWSKKDGGEGVGTGKKEEKCADKVGSSWGRRGRRALGWRGGRPRGGGGEGELEWVVVRGGVGSVDVTGAEGQGLGEGRRDECVIEE